MKKNLKNKLEEVCALFEKKGELFVKAHSSTNIIILDKYRRISKQADQKLESLKQELNETD